MSILAVSIAGGATAYLALRPRRSSNSLVDVISEQPNPDSTQLNDAIDGLQTSRIAELYEQAQTWLHEKPLPSLNLLNPATLLPISHREPAVLAHQLASPWQKNRPESMSMTSQEASAGRAARMNRGTEVTASEQWDLYRRYLIGYWRPYWKIGALSVGLGLSFSLYRIAFANVLNTMLGNVVTLKTGAILIMLLKFLIALPFVFALTVLGELLARRITSRLTNDIRYDMFEHTQNLSLDYYKRNKLGDLLSRFSTDITHIEQGMGTGIADSAAKLASILAYMIALFLLEWHLALFVLLFMPASVYLLRRYMPIVTTANRKLRQSDGNALSVVQEGIRAQPIAQSFGIRQFIQDSYWQELRDLESDSIWAGYQITVFQNLSLSSIYLLDVASMGLGLLFVVGGVTSIATLLAFQTLVATMRRDVTFISGYMNNIVQSAGSIARVDELLQTPIDLVDAEGAKPLPRFHENIRFEDIFFSYTGEEYQLEQINLTIEAGQFVAFVGPSGAGKSTIFNLLMRFYDVSGGSLTIDGHDVRDVTQLSLRANMGVVFQETFIFNSSVLNNIRVVCPDATEEEVMEAAEAAELHDFIMTLPHGYHTNVGEGGGKLSGGQKQRIAIARAMLYDPDILLLDEATSSLDADTAAAVNATIHNLARSRTVISITHHLSSVVNADKIYVLGKGHLVEEGDHESLLIQDKVYAQLWQSQTNEVSSSQPPNALTS